MTKEIDARGLACPQPVILTKKALGDNNEITVIVDNETAEENVRRMAQSQGCETTIDKKDGNIYIHVARVCSGETTREEEQENQQKPVVIVIGSNTMGRGNEALGEVLMKSFIHTLIETSPRPDTMIFLNTGVKLAVTGSDVLEDLNVLSGSGVKILVCGTCLNFFEIQDQLRAGTVSNMYDITEAMLGAGRLAQI